MMMVTMMTITEVTLTNECMDCELEYYFSLPDNL